MKVGQLKYKLYTRQIVDNFDGKFPYKYILCVTLLMLIWCSKIYLFVIKI